MLIVNSILIGLVLMLITITLLDRQHNRKALNTKEQEIMSLTKMIVDQNDHVNNAVKKYFDLNKTAVTLVHPAKQANVSFKGKARQPIDIPIFFIH